MENNTKSKVNLIYIVGGGHSGSTLLEMIIGSAKEVFCLGEFSFFDSKLKNIYHEKNVSKICTCGRNYENCIFWSQIKKIINFNKIGIIKKYNFIENCKIILGIFNPFKKVKKIKIRVGDDGKIFEAISSCIKSNGVRYLIDSSKDPRRLIQLMKCENINVLPIFLVRDGRGYANSYNRKKRVELGLKRKGFYSSIFEWIVLNIFTIILLKKSGIRYLKIPYDLFCKNTERYIKRINKHFNIYIPNNYLDIINEKDNYHNIAGNQLRFKEIGEIKADIKWKDEQGFFNRLFGTLIAGLFNLIWIRDEKDMD